jgi:inner membrane protein
MDNNSSNEKSNEVRNQQDEVTANYAERESWIRTSVTFKMFSIAFLAIILLIPAFMIQMVIQDREYRRNEAVQEISSKWGNEQTLAGPILTVPYKATIKDEAGNISNVTQYAHFLPDKLEVKGSLQPEVRYRGIYEAVLYTGKLQFGGQFSFPNFDDWTIDKQDILWNKAFLSVGIPDMRGINDKIELAWNSQKMLFEPGIESPDVVSSGVSVATPLVADKKGDTFTFDFQLNLNGSERLKFLPLGKETTVSLSSPWRNPSFDGAFLPDTRNIDTKGFTAQWKVLHLNRNFPQQWLGNGQNIQESAFGVKLLTPIDEYQKTARSSKYAIMFIFLTFLGFFFVEILNKMRIHPAQYLLVGAALCVFYLLLISLSEHIKFNPAYWVSTAATVILITAYSSTIFRSKKLTISICITLLALYGFLYSLLQLQDYALLMGSLGLFSILAAIMYLSRNIDWYNLGNTKK